MGVGAAAKAACLPILFLSQSSFAEVVREPLSVKNLSPLQAVIGIPAQRSAVGTEGFAITVNTALASHFVSRQTTEENVLFDGETQHHSLGLRWRLSEGWEATVQLPMRHHSGGFADSYINDWHDFFGMSDGGRSVATDNQLEFRYQAPNQALLLTRDSSGLGDFSFEVSRLDSPRDSISIAYAVGYEAGSGSTREWLGNGCADWYAVTRVSGDLLEQWPIYWHAQLGVSRPAQGGIFGTNNRSSLVFTGLSAEWVVSDQWSLIAQVDSHESAFKSSLAAVGESAVMLGLGLRRQLAAGWAADIGFVEDIRVETAPDIIFQASIYYRPH